MGLQRSTLRYGHRQQVDGRLRARLRDLVAKRPRFGYRRPHVLLRREGYRVNHKRIHRLYREKGLTVRRRKHKRTAAGRERIPAVGTHPNERWCLDFVSDALASGRQLRILAILDTCTREALTIEVDHSTVSMRSGSHTDWTCNRGQVMAVIGTVSASHVCQMHEPGQTVTRHV